MAFIRNIFDYFLCIHPSTMEEDFVTSSIVGQSPFRSRESSPNVSRKFDPIRGKRLEGTQDIQLKQPTESSDLDECCPVCLDQLICDKCYVLPRCGHMVHIVCMDKWSTRKARCPICWKVVSTDFGGVNIPENIEKYVRYGAPKRKRILHARYGTRGNW